MAQLNNLIVTGSSRFLNVINGACTDGTAGTTKYMRQDGTWQVPPNDNTDVNVKVNNTNPTSGTWYYPTWYTATSGTGNLNANDGLSYYSLQGTTSDAGRTILSLGNNTATGTAGNKYGELRIYGGKAGYATIKATATATEGTMHTLPNTAGTILNSGTTSFTQTLTSGTKIGSIKINGSSTDIYSPTPSFYGTCTTAADTVAKVVTCTAFTTAMTDCPAGTTIRVKFTNGNTATNPTLNVNSKGAVAILKHSNEAPGVSKARSWRDTSIVDFTYDGTNWIMNDVNDFASATSVITENPSSSSNYWVTFVSNSPTSTGSYNQKGNDGFKYFTKEGTTSARGYGCLILGNSINTGTAGNKYGAIRLYSEVGGNYSQIEPPYELGVTSNITHKLPCYGGTLLNSGNTYLNFNNSSNKLELQYCEDTTSSSSRIPIDSVTIGYASAAAALSLAAAVGHQSQPVYFSANGTPTKCGCIIFNRNIEGNGSHLIQTCNRIIVFVARGGSTSTPVLAILDRYGGITYISRNDNLATVAIQLTQGGEYDGLKITNKLSVYVEMFYIGWDTSVTP